MKHLPIEYVWIACGGTLHGSAPAGELTDIVTDSRQVTEGCMFAAIRGERVDGHDFIPAAFAAGAACCLVERVPADMDGCFIQVADTQRALQQIAGFYRSQFQIPVVGVTGSVGKTTAKEMLASVLEQRYHVLKTAGNFNNDLGVPLTIFRLREEHTAAVVELGVSHPGDMARIAEIARPTMALYTNIGDAHLEFLGSREGILAEKASMNRYLPNSGVVFCNGDDPLLSGMSCGRKTVRFGLGSDCEVRAEQIKTLAGGRTGCTICAGASRFDVIIPAFGEHLVYAALGAAAVGLELGLTGAEIAAGIAGYLPVGSRARLVEGRSLTIIDDCYNANPTSMASALRSLAAFPSEGRKVCILGDMLELGEQSARLHHDIGVLARECGIALVLTTGQEAKSIALGAGNRAQHYESKTALLASLRETLQTGDTVLVKASHGAHFEDITAALEALEL